jgi:hypothetical protein
MPQNHGLATGALCGALDAVHIAVRDDASATALPDEAEANQGWSFVVPCSKIERDQAPLFILG